ncbi:MAG: hypothetical protein AAGJ31_14690, partial [Verrucomicrobiota bacterium]
MKRPSAQQLFSLSRRPSFLVKGTLVILAVSFGIATFLWLVTAGRAQPAVQSEEEAVALARSRLLKKEAFEKWGALGFSPILREVVEAYGGAILFEKEMDGVRISKLRQYAKEKEPFAQELYGDWLSARQRHREAQPYYRGELELRASPHA